MIHRFIDSKDNFEISPNQKFVAKVGQHEIMKGIILDPSFLIRSYIPPRIQYDLHMAP